MYHSGLQYNQAVVLPVKEDSLPVSKTPLISKLLSQVWVRMNALNLRFGQQLMLII